MKPNLLIIRDLSKSFDGRPVLKQVSLELTAGQIYCLMGPSGSGKTTLLRILLGLEQADSGTISSPFRFSAVFQENRLCESFSVLDNVMLAARTGLTRSQAARELTRLLPEESLLRPASTLSGGMKRRAAIARALFADADAVLMDEPFAGLDDATRQSVIAYIKEKTVGKLVVISTHQEEDLDLLNGTLITIS